MTSPSLSEARNVSGISSVVKAIVDQLSIYQETLSFDLFIVGREDGQKKNIKWLLRQLILPFSLIFNLLKNNPNITHVNGPLDYLAAVRDSIIILISRAFFKKVIYHIHGGPYVHIKSPSLLVNISIKLNACLANRIIVLGHSEKSSIQDIYHADSNKIVVMPNAIEVNSNHSFNKPASDHLNILFMGRFVESKGVEILVQALTELAKSKYQFTVSFYGAGPLESYIIDSLSQALDGNFIFGGIAKRDSKIDIFKQADVLVLPSLWGEGLPMVILEAMSHGVPVVATSDGSIADAVKNGINGILVPKNDSVALCKAFENISILKNSGDFDAMRVAAYNTALNNYDISNYSERLYSLYTDIQ